MVSAGLCIHHLWIGVREASTGYAIVSLTFNSSHFRLIMHMPHAASNTPMRVGTHAAERATGCVSTRSRDGRTGSNAISYLTRSSAL